MTAGQFITHAQRATLSCAYAPQSLSTIVGTPISACIAFVFLITLPQAIYRMRAWRVYIARAKRVYRSRVA